MSSQKVSLIEIEKLLSKAAAKFVSLEEAQYFAKAQIECTLFMYPDVNPINSAVEDLESWEKLKASKIEIQVDKSGTFLVDFNRLGPSLKLKWVHDKIEEKAKLNGIAMFGLNNSNVTDWLKLWTYGLAKRNLIAMYVFNGGLGTVPYGGSEPIFGTNPLSYAIPTEDDPILVDMATSESAFYKYSRALKDKHRMREGVLVDQNGNLTCDPVIAISKDKENARILPMGGGYKGYNIVLLIEILTGALVRSFMGLEKSAKYTKHEYGGLLIAIDISGLTDLDKFKSSVSKMCKDIRSQKHGDHVTQVIVPGDHAHFRAKKLRAEGVLELDLGIYEKLKNWESQK